MRKFLATISRGAKPGSIEKDYGYIDGKPGFRKGWGGILLAIPLLALLAACSGIQGSEQIVGTAVTNKIEFNDNKSRLLLIAVCDMSVGSYHRVLDDAKRRSVDTLCGGEWQRPVTADDIRTIRELYEIMGAGR